MDLVIMGLILAWLTHRAGVAWGRTRRCWIAVLVRITAGVPLYLSAFLLVATGAMGMQVFDGGLIGTTNRRGAGSLWAQQMTEVLTFIRAQERLNDGQARTDADILKRLTAIEQIHPDALAIQLETLRAGQAKQEAATERTNQLGIGLLIAVVVAGFTQWLSTKKPK